MKSSKKNKSPSGAGGGDAEGGEQGLLPQHGEQQPDAAGRADMDDDVGKKIYGVSFGSSTSINELKWLYIYVYNIVVLYYLFLYIY